MKKEQFKSVLKQMINEVLDEADFRNLAGEQGESEMDEKKVQALAWAKNMMRAVANAKMKSKNLTSDALNQLDTLEANLQKLINQKGFSIVRAWEKAKGTTNASAISSVVNSELSGASKWQVNK